MEKLTTRLEQLLEALDDLRSRTSRIKAAISGEGGLIKRINADLLTLGLSDKKKVGPIIKLINNELVVELAVINKILNRRDVLNAKGINDIGQIFKDIRNFMRKNKTKTTKLMKDFSPGDIENVSAIFTDFIKVNDQLEDVF